MNPIEPKLVSYWCGYRDGTLNPLSSIPKIVHVVPLAFAGLNPDSTMTVSYLSKRFSMESILSDVRILQSRGQKVTLSLLDSDAVHWNDIHIDTFIQSAKSLAIDQWKLDGFDIDAEGSAIDHLKQIVPKLRQAIGPEPIISYTTYQCSAEDQSILETIKDDIDWVQTMAYFEAFDDMTRSAQFYADIVGKSRVLIGVKVGMTPITECTKLASWVSENGYGGMMVWSADMDNPTFSSQRKWTWIRGALSPPCRN